jgi:para-aminobenzoate synthetase
MDRVQDPGSLSAVIAARYPRMFWLDGAGGRPWSGRRSIIGFLDEDDYSITPVVWCVISGHAEVSGNDPFSSLESEMARGWLLRVRGAGRPSRTGGHRPPGPRARRRVDAGVQAAGRHRSIIRDDGARQ